MVTIKRIILSLPSVIPTGCVWLTRAPRHTLLPGADLLSHACLIWSRGEPCSGGELLLPWPPATLGWVGFFFFDSLNQQRLHFPKLRREGSAVLQAQNELVGTKREERNLVPSCRLLTESFSSLFLFSL